MFDINGPAGPAMTTKNGPTRAKLVRVINVNAIKAKPLDTILVVISYTE